MYILNSGLVRIPVVIKDKNSKFSRALMNALTGIYYNVSSPQN